MQTQPSIESGTSRIKGILSRRPLYIGIETTNICNARCVFCAYRKMRRAKEVMPQALFEKIIGDYVDMGGGAIGLTPIVGDTLLDPHLLDRLRTLRDTDQITHISFTTNGIAWDRYSKTDQAFILSSTDVISLSLGGLDAASYEKMFAVDRFAKVRKAIDAMCELKSRYALPVEIHLLFRVNQPADELMADPRMSEFHRPEINHISSINRFGNWGGLITSEDLPTGAHLARAERRERPHRQDPVNPCFVFFVGPEITCNGKVSACGCMNAEAEELILGDVAAQHLRDIWRGGRVDNLKASFTTGKMPRICDGCSYYSDGERFVGNPALWHFEVGDNPWEVLRRHAPPEPARLLSDVLDRLVAEGHRRIALYGAGTFTRSALAAESFNASRWPIVAIIDDNTELKGDRVGGLPVVSKLGAAALEIDAVILSSDWHTAQLWHAAKPFRDSGVRVALIDEDRDPSPT